MFGEKEPKYLQSTPLIDNAQIKTSLQGVSMFHLHFAFKYPQIPPLPKLHIHTHTRGGLEGLWGCLIPSNKYWLNAMVLVFLGWSIWGAVVVVNWFVGWLGGWGGGLKEKARKVYPKTDIEVLNLITDQLSSCQWRQSCSSAHHSKIFENGQLASFSLVNNSSGPPQNWKGRRKPFLTSQPDLKVAKHWETVVLRWRGGKVWRKLSSSNIVFLRSLLSSARSPLVLTPSCTSPISYRSPLLFNQPDPGSNKSWILDLNPAIPDPRSRSKRSRILHPDPLSWPLTQVRGDFLELQPNEEIMPRSEIKRKTDCKTNFWRFLSIFLLATSSQEKHKYLDEMNHQKRRRVVKFIFTSKRVDNNDCEYFSHSMAEEGKRRPESSIWWSEKACVIVRKQSVVKEREKLWQLYLEWSWISSTNSRSSSSQRSAAAAGAVQQKDQVPNCQSESAANQLATPHLICSSFGGFRQQQQQQQQHQQQQQQQQLPTWAESRCHSMSWDFGAGVCLRQRWLRSWVGGWPMSSGEGIGAKILHRN